MTFRQQRQFHFQQTLLLHVLCVLLACSSISCLADEVIRISPATIKLIRECEIPASDSGTLSEIKVVEGDAVASGGLIASMESRQQELAVRLAELNLESAKEDALDELSVLTAEQAVVAAERRLETLQKSLRVAESKAANRASLDIAETNLSTIAQQLERAKAAKDAFDKSVSEAEMIRLTAEHKKAQLAVSEATSLLSSGELEVQVKRADIHEHHATISQAKLLADQERRKLHVLERTKVVRSVELEAAKLMLDRRRLAAPISGIVAQVYHQVGEYVEAGSPVARIVQLSRLKAEGYIELKHASSTLVGTKVVIEINDLNGVPRRIDGVITYISSEVEPLNQQVRICAEFDSPESQILPGMTGSILVHKGTKAAEGESLSGNAGQIAR